MASYRLSTVAEEDLLRIYHYGVITFGIAQADIYFESFFDCFNRIAASPYAFEAKDNIRKGYRRCVCGSDSVYFRVTDGLVEIMAIIGRQDFNASK